MLQPDNNTSSINERMLQLSNGYDQLLHQPFTFYDLKLIREELRDLNLQLKQFEENAALNSAEESR